MKVSHTRVLPLREYNTAGKVMGMHMHARTHTCIQTYAHRHTCVHTIVLSHDSTSLLNLLLPKLRH